MTDPPFGFNPPSDPGDRGKPPAGGPLGPLGDPQQFADALRQFADLMSYQGGVVNWDLAKNVARQTVAAKGDPSVLDVERQQVADALRVADLWLEDVTSFPTGIRSVQAWSQSEWVEATMPVWSKLCDPIAERAVDAMGGMLTEDPGELGGMPPELQAAMSAMKGGLGGLGGFGQMMRRMGGLMVGGQTGAALARMKQSAYLVNIARGRVIDEPALIEALSAGRIAGAALDVTVEEPLPPSSPLLGMEHVLITPHTAGETRRYEDNVIEILRENLNRLRRGSAKYSRTVRVSTSPMPRRPRSPLVA